MVDSETETISASLTPGGVLARLERQLEQGRKHGRDVDELFRQLSVALTDDWPEPPLERLELSIRAFRAASVWSGKIESPPRAIRVSAEIAISHIDQSLRVLPDAEVVPLAESLLDAWAEATTVPRTVVSAVLLGGCGEATRRSFQMLSLRRGHRLKHQVTALLEAIQGGDASTATARDYALFHARLLSRAGKLDDALGVLDDEPVSDPRVLLTYADLYQEHGRLEESIDRLKRSLVIAPDKRAVRERLFDAYLEIGDEASAVDQFLLLLRETGDTTYWGLLCTLMGSDGEERLRELLRSFEAEAPALYMEILIAQGDVNGVVEVSKAKTFSYQQLWRMGDFLADNGSSKASRVYERAVALQGAVAQSKAQCQDLGSRLEFVMPYFASIDRPTKVERMAKELMSRNKTNVPLRRELERIFGPGFK